VDHKSLSAADKARLRRAHELRMQAHWGKNAPMGAWPETDAEWRQTPYGAPWDANVHMAEWHLKLAAKMKEEGLV